MAINPKPFRGGLDFANQAALLEAMIAEKRKDYLSNQGTSKPASFKGGLDFANQAAFEDVLRAAEEEQVRQSMERSRLADIAREENKMAEYQSLYPANNRLYGITPRPPTEVGRGGFQPPTIDLDRATRQRTGDMEFLQSGPYQRTFNTPTLSEALAEILTEPNTEAPSEGVVMETVGGVVSPLEFASA